MPTTHERPADSEFVWPTEPGWYDVWPGPVGGTPVPNLLMPDGTWWCHLDGGASHSTELMKEWGLSGVRKGEKPRDSPYPSLREVSGTQSTAECRPAVDPE
jgi:hypothetical protein